MLNTVVYFREFNKNVRLGEHIKPRPVNTNWGTGAAKYNLGTGGQETQKPVRVIFCSSIHNG